MSGEHAERPRAAELGIASAAVMIGAGAILLGLQVDGNGRVSGTGYAPFAIGALLALVATLVRYGGAARLPRDLLSASAAAFSFFALASLLSGVLAPGGPWMFAEVLLLLVLVTRGKSVRERWLGPAAITCLGVLLLFRLWITYQGSEYRWQVLSVGIPILSWIPLSFLEPIQSVSLGSFTPHELGFPPAGLDFAVTMTAWAGGFTLSAAGLLLGQAAAREHENDRIDALIATLPPPLAALVEKLLPEEEWEALGLHGLGDRQLAKRIEALVAERLQRQREFQSAWEASQSLSATRGDGFEGSIHQALARHAPPPRRVEDEAREART
jgi:hypothetical protein